MFDFKLKLNVNSKLHSKWLWKNSAEKEKEKFFPRSLFLFSAYWPDPAEGLGLLYLASSLALRSPPGPALKPRGPSTPPPSWAGQKRNNRREFLFLPSLSRCQIGPARQRPFFLKSNRTGLCSERQIPHRLSSRDFGRACNVGAPYKSRRPLFALFFPSSLFSCPSSVSQPPFGISPMGTRATAVVSFVRCFSVVLNPLPSISTR